MNKNEYHIQVALVQWMRIQYPNMLFTISPSGMKLPIGAAMKLKRMGYRAGTPDLLILEPRGGWYGLFIELKTEDGVVSENQKIFINELNKRSYLAKICFGFDDAEGTIKNYMEKTPLC